MRIWSIAQWPMKTALKYSWFTKSGNLFKDCLSFWAISLAVDLSKVRD